MQLSERSRRLRTHGPRFVVSSRPRSRQTRAERARGAENALADAVLWDERDRMEGAVCRSTSALFAVTVQLAAIESVLEGSSQARVVESIEAMDAAMAELRRSFIPPRLVVSPMEGARVVALGIGRSGIGWRQAEADGRLKACHGVW
jgi:hypothetical protein